MAKATMTELGKGYTQKYGHLTYSKSKAPGTIDCSNLVHRILNDGGIPVSYHDTHHMAGSGDYEIIDGKDVQPGDVVMFPGHAGIVTSYNVEKKSGTFFGSQSKGPQETYFGAEYPSYGFPSITAFLRPKKKLAQVSKPAIPPYAPLKWAYPIKLSKSATGFAPAEYFAGLSRSLGGTYPMGANGLWHPGVHFDLGGASHLDPNAGVFAIADGQIVAYRIDPEPLKIRYPASGALSEYSSSFVLLKHKLQIPPKPPAPAASDPAPLANNNYATTSTSPGAGAEQPFITLYSLYMHLMDAKSYSDTTKNLPWPPYLIRKAKVKSGLHSTPKGLRLRDKPGGIVLGVIPKLCRVVLGTAHPSNHQWKKITAISGLAVPAWTGADAYIYAKSLTGGTTVGDNCNDIQADIAITKVAYVHSQPKSAANNIIANIPEGAIITLGPADKSEPHFHKILALENMQGFPEPKNTDGTYYGWVDIDDLETLPYNPASGVQTVVPAIDVNAGDLIGHPGIYQHHNNLTPQIQVHIELFTPDDLPAFLAKSREWAKDPNVPEREKTLLRVPAGTKLLASDGATPPGPPNPNGERNAIHCELILPLSALNALKPQYKATLPESTAANAKTWRYWYLENVAGQAGGKPLSGWLCEKDVIKTSPWDWPGFECIEDNTADEQLIAYQLKNTNKLRGEEISKYAAVDNLESSSPLLKKLIEIIKANPVENTTPNPLTYTQLLSASKGFWCAQKIAGLAVKTKTEWKKDEARWNALDEIMGHHLDDEHPDWVAEKQKIRGMSFFDDVTAILNSNGNSLWHLNAAETTITHSRNNKCELTVDLFREIFGNIRLFTASNMPTDCSAYDISIERFVELLNEGFVKYNINCCSQIAHFLSQSCHESAHFNTTMEYASGSDYDIGSYPASVCEGLTAETMTHDCKRRNQIIAEGNTSIGDGPKYKGHGIIQVTWKSAHQKYQDYSGAQVVNNPMLLCKDINLAVDSAFWIWCHVKKLDVKIPNWEGELSAELDADPISAGETIVTRVTKAINGGSNGLADRKSLFKKIKEHLK